MFSHDSKYKIVLILGIIIIAIVIAIFKNYNEQQSNGRDMNKKQLRIEETKIVRRSSNDETSSSLGYVYKGEIYTILEEEDNWYKIKTNTDITGWIYGGENYIYLYQTEEKDIEIENKEESYSLEILKDYLMDNYTYINNTYQREENNTKYIFNLNSNEYRVINNIDITYNYSTKEMIYKENNTIVKWNTKTNEITSEIDRETARNIVDNKMKQEYESFKNILIDLNITEDELIKKEV
jgi:hypothetical protein